ncbi:hypothetical protein AQ490_13680 [Wenjunlia vitaminophila]|uniref:DUF4188 domain-containing protein n=1 Tax=Wenjunlia vitaminophila TaxID=76728 RepID=A0A0T6LXP2_WENVI|nr:DUF4188 domain-containing protein [Wenjunlia vitaminophila]KRV50809.1 hypothetical protein AQ490_13680 [Wenjunlia vitaminophila]
MSRKPIPGRTTAALEGDAVVLLIGMRINHFWAVHQWTVVFFSMLRMLRELAKDGSRGLLGRSLVTASPRTYYVVQYWESKEKLYAYARDPGTFHHRMWGFLNRQERAGKARQHVGLWHETFIAPVGSYESIYFDMPPFGLAAATGTLPIERRGRSAAERFAHRPATAAPAEQNEVPTETTDPVGAADH